MRFCCQPGRVALLLFLSHLAFAGPVYIQTNLTSDIPGLAANTDPNLVNPWGMSFSATSPFWISNQGSNNSTLYNAAGVPQPASPLIVNTPPGPTGQVFNGSSDFQVGPNQPARFIFATLSGTVSGWNPAANATNAIIEYSATDNAVYTGLASGQTASGRFLYAADFANGKIDVLDANFDKVSSSGGFTDPNLPAGYAPFGVENINGSIYVQYAKVDPVTHRASEDLDQGVVDEYDLNGNLIRRLATDAHLSSPWGIALAPAGFGAFANTLLVGNFGEGTISAFDPATGNFLGMLSDAMGNPIENDGLWAIKFRASGSGFDPNTLFFAAGIEDETHGLFGSITQAPEPGTFVLAGAAISLLLLKRRRVS